MGHKLAVHSGSGEKCLSDWDIPTPQEGVLDYTGRLSWEISVVFPEHRLHIFLTTFHEATLGVLDMETSTTYLVALN